MSAFINTVDIIGDEALVDSIIDRSITELRDKHLTAIGPGVFRECNALTVLELPSVKTVLINGIRATGLMSLCLPALHTIDMYGMRDNYALRYADFPVLTTLKGYGLTSCSSLQALILRSTTLCSLSDVSALSGTRIAKGYGYIYVPRALLDDYKSATNWSTYAAQFRGLEDYTVDSTISGEFDRFNAGVEVHPGVVELPAGYTQLSYIKATGKQYIKTNIVPTDDLVVKFTNFLYDPNIITWGGYLGSQTEDNATDSWIFRRNSSSDNWAFDVAYGHRLTCMNERNASTVVLTSGSLSVNGAAVTNAPPSISATYPLWIFTVNCGGSAFRNGNGAFGRLEMTNNTGLIADYVACENPDGEIGLYDLVSKTFHGNDSGVGVFYGGVAITKSKEETA